MLKKYIEAALRRAKYEILSDDGSFYGEIPSFDGVTPMRIRLKIAATSWKKLEEWFLFRVSRNLLLPAGMPVGSVR